MYKRDPLSVSYDGAVRSLMLRAAREAASRRAIRAWVASPRAEYRARDAGGRTRHERAFTRSAYYLVFRAPLNRGQVPDWSLRLDWGADEDLRPSSQNRLARPVMIRLRPRAQARIRGDQWTGNAALQSGGQGSPKRRF